MDNAQEQAINPNKLFVGNLPWSVNDAQLAELFGQYGQLVEAKVITDKFSGRSKGIAFVEYDNAQSAQDAMGALNGYEMENRALVVNVARPKKPREDNGGPRRSFDRRGGNGGGGYNRGGYGDRN